MSKSTDEATATLIEMGYRPDLIALAMEESINKNLEEVLDLLLFRDKKYRKILAQRSDKKPNKQYAIMENIPKFIKISQNKNKKSKQKKKADDEWTDEEDEEDWEDEIEEVLMDVPVEVTKICFGGPSKNVTLGKNKNKKKEEEKLKQAQEQANKDKEEASKEALKKEENVEEEMSKEQRAAIIENLPKALNQDVEEYLGVIIEDLFSVDSKDPNAYTRKLDKYLDQIRNDGTTQNKTLQLYLCSKLKIPLILELKNQIFTMLNKLLTMRIKKKYTFNVKKFENLILAVFEMRLLSPKQMDGMILTYKAFCDRLLHPDLFSEILKKLYLDAMNSVPLSAFSGLKKDYDFKIWEDKSLVDNPNLMSVQGKDEEEFKNGDERDNAEDDYDEDAIVSGFVSQGESEECIVCMERTREIVFMPCCHFLTCPLCSPRIGKCPMCNKRIDKHLKIHWG